MTNQRCLPCFRALFDVVACCCCSLRHILYYSLRHYLDTIVAQVSPECDKAALPEAAREQLDKYDKELYLEPDCVDPSTPLPMHCNFMGLGQECRACFMTCDGAERYIMDFADEYAVWVSAPAGLFRAPGIS